MEYGYLGFEVGNYTLKVNPSRLSIKMWDENFCIVSHGLTLMKIAILPCKGKSLFILRWAAAYFFHGSDQKILDFQN